MFSLPSLTAVSADSVPALLTRQLVQQLSKTTEYHLLRLALQEGIDVLVCQGELTQSAKMNVQDDGDRIHFSCALRGCSQFSFHGGSEEIEYVLLEGASCIRYNTGCSGLSSHAQKFESVTVSVRPDLFEIWTHDVDLSLQQELRSGRCYAECHCNAEMRATAQALSHALSALYLYPNDGANRTPLWLMGQSLTMMSLALEGCRRAAQPASEFSMADKQKLLLAKDRLLSDLSQAPTIAALANEVNLSVMKLKRGFRQLFNHSVYGLFQQERMHEARRRLCAQDAPVMLVAADLGYTNASHFAAAFQKQFGVKPSALKRRR